MARVERLEEWTRSLGFATARTASIGMEKLVKDHRGWPRQGMQFCTEDLKIAPTDAWLAEHDPDCTSIQLIGVRRSESVRRRSFPERSTGTDGRTIWAPLVDHTDEDRNALLERAGEAPLPHRSMECFPCVNSNRRDLLDLAEDPARIAHIEGLETALGFTKMGKPRTMFRPYHYMGATGIREIVRWAQSERGKFSLDDGNGSPGCAAGWCGS